MKPEPQRTTSPASAAAPAPPLPPDVGLLVMAVIWGVNFPVLKIALDELSPLALNALRFPLAALLVLMILRWRGPIRIPLRADRWRLLALGLLGNVIYQLFFIFGLDHTRAGNAALLLAATPIMTALLSRAVGHERVGSRVWAGVFTTLAGMTLVILGGGRALAWGAETLLGDLLMFGAVGAWSAFTVGARGPVARHGSIVVTAWTLWMGTVVLFLVGLPDLVVLEWQAVSWRAWAAVVWTGAFGIGLAYLLWYRGVHRIGNTRTAVYGNVVPVVALLAAWLWIGEVPTAWQLVGAGVIIGGVTLARSRP